MKKYLVPTFTLVMLWFLLATLYAPNDGPLPPVDIKVHQDNPNSGPEGQARKYINAPEVYIASNLFCLWPNEQAKVKVKLPPPFDQQQNLPAGLIKWTVPGHTIPDNTLEAPLAWNLGLINNTKEVKINIGGSEFMLHFKVQGVGFLSELEASALLPNAAPVMLYHRQEAIDYGATFPAGLSKTQCAIPIGVHSLSRPFLLPSAT